jgi:hypothetical protein
MRTALLVCAIMASWSAALAAGGRSAAPVKQLSLSAAAVRTLRAGLSPTALQSLSGSITRQQQLMSLHSDPVMGKRLGDLGLNTTTQPMSGDPWSTGVAVAPLTPLYPASATYGTFQLALQTRAAWLGPFSPLPSPSQSAPLLWLNVDSNQPPLFWVEVNWPSTGVYVITLLMKDLWPTSTARPRVFKNGAGMQTPVPNTPSGGDRWTILWEVSSPNSLHENVGVYPAESGLGFTCCCLSRVVISKL